MLRERPGNYPDCVKVLTGLVMTGDGFPVAHHVFPGNTADINAFRSALSDLRRRFPIRRVVMVADRSVVCEELMEELVRTLERLTAFQRQVESLAPTKT